MFGFFKKKDVVLNVEPRNVEIIRIAAQMIDIQLHLCRSNSDFDQRFCTDVVRGYLFGFFDAAIQYAKISHENFELLVVLGHSYLLSGNVEKARAYVLESASRQGSEEFRTSQKRAGDEYFSYLDGKFSQPIGLMTYFQEG